MMIAPAVFNRSTTVESRVAAGVPTSTFDPPSVVTPASSNRSLIEIGMPASAGSFAPSRRRASTWSAAASASLSCTLRKVREPSPCGSLIAASACRTSSRLVIFPLARSSESSTMVIVASSCPDPLAREQADAPKRCAGKRKSAHTSGVLQKVSTIEIHVFLPCKSCLFAPIGRPPKLGAKLENAPLRLCRQCRERLSS